MNNKLVGAIAFSLGAAIGSIVTWRLLKTKYEQIAQEEIDSAKEYYKERYSEEKDTDQPEIIESGRPEITPDEKASIREYSSLVRDYTSSDEQKEVEYVTEPYVISPAEFGEKDDYETQSLTYYADNILADDMDNVIYDAGDVVGDDFDEHFGEYEDDSVFVRNERLKCDFEILSETRKFSEIKPKNPRQMEVEWQETD